MIECSDCVSIMGYEEKKKNEAISGIRCMKGQVTVNFS